MINSSGEQRREDKLFLRLALGSTIVTFLLIVVGAITRVTQSGMGCGTDLRVCNGATMPEFPNKSTLLGFSHRLGAPLMIIFGQTLLIWPFWLPRADSLLFFRAFFVLLLYLFNLVWDMPFVLSSKAWFCGLR